MDLATYIATNRNKRANADIAERWQTRVLSQGLQTMGEAGAEQYLNLYGRGIAAPKCIMFAVQATNEGHPLMAMGFWKKAYQLETGLIPGMVSVSVVGNPQVTRPAAPALPTSEFLPPNLQPGKLVTMQPEDAQHPRAQYLEREEYWGQPKRDGNKVVIFAAPDGIWYQSRSMKLRASVFPMMDAALLKIAKDKSGAFILEGELYFLDYTGGEHRTGAQAATVNIEANQGGQRPQTRYMPFYAIYRPDRDLRDATHAIRVLEGNAIASELHDLSEIFVVPVTFRTAEEKAFLAQQQQADGREGEVWTRATALYHAGKDKSDDVVRTKYLTEFDARIVSLTATTAQGRLFGAIEIAHPITGKPLGNVGTGFDLETQKKIQKMQIANPGKVIIPVISQGFTETGVAFHARLSEDFN